jgi:hypothetical protein
MPAGATRQADSKQVATEQPATKREGPTDAAVPFPATERDEHSAVARPTDHVAPDALRQDERGDVTSPTSAEAGENVHTPQTRRAERRRRRITRSRRIVLAVVLLVGATLLITWRSALRTRYARDLEQDTAAGYAALVDADFVTAERLLDRARRAAVGLGGDAPAARRAVQLHHEASLWKSLLARPVDDLYGALATANSGNGNGDVWRRVFDQAYRGRNLIIATQIRLGDDVNEPPVGDGGTASDNDPAAPARVLYLNDWSLVGEGVEIRLALGDIALLRRVPLDGPQEVILGGEIAELRPDAEQANLWWLTLVADSCTLITVAEPLAYYGWPADDTLDELLAQQHRWLGIEANDP